MYRVIFSLLTLSIIFSASAQSLYMPRNVKDAFKKETRSPDGRPGKNYWQNYGRYNITVTALPPDRNIKGAEQITYINNSPDTLKNPVFRLTINIHKPGVLRYGTTDSTYFNSGVHIDSFTVNGESQIWRSNSTVGTWQSVRLQKPLMPKDSIKFSFVWHYEISLLSSREGMLDSTTYFLAYFYPRVAVFDDYNGWDRLDFTDQQEFYNDFNDYTLQVVAPKNYIVWSTGTLQNPNEVLQPEYAKKLNESMKTDSVIRIAAPADLSAKKITAQHETNTWRWTANDISDVTVALSDHYNWDASSVIVDDATKRRASVQSAYNDKAKDFHYMVSFGRHSLDWLSHNWPGVPYPFPKTTIVQGFADMEYPMMVNDGTNADTVFSRFVVEHEIAHTWFPFYMGINESRYAFMDEGWATTFELLIGRADLGVQRAENFYKQFRVNGWILDPSQEEDLPIITPANVLRNQAYGNNAYGKPSLAYFAMKDYLGDDMFRKCLHAFMDRWHGKHPIPWDFFNTFNDVSGKNLNWFWSNWFFTTNYIDLAVQKVDATNNGYTLSIQNIGGFPIPFDIKINYENGSSETIHKTPEIWSADQKQVSVNISATKKIQSLKLDGGIFVDADESNNTWNSK
ncbi:MAG TPA: M1 family metallopeptidase [Puia sp.]|nr:M1 family metallopeptidase [Puia sp.]